ncbi:carbamate kinase [Levilactobacillus brevis]|nr:carbamate kinase [Levilactobacillus brevis]
MTKRKIVVALGGNAILADDASAAAQQAALAETAKYLVQFVKQGDQLIISHGNGPQVGNLLLQQAAGSTAKNPAMPLDTAVAMTQGSIGYWLENAMDKALADAGLPQDVATIVTQVAVADDDPAFSDPGKPIGPFYTSAEITAERQAHPDNVNALVDAGVIPVAVGGGGVPVVKVGNQLVGREAVIDKDFASEKLAELVHADLLIILTAVDHVFVNFNQPDQKQLTTVTAAELTAYIQDDQFAKGSMLPKIQAALDFVNNRPSGQVVITSLANVGNFLENGSGTIIRQ